MEQITLTAPVLGTAATGSLIPTETCLSVGVTYGGNGQRIITPALSKVRVVLSGDHRHTITDEWHGEEAHTDILAISKADLRTNTLPKRIMAKVIARGTIKDAEGNPVGGTVTGNPD